MLVGVALVLHTYDCLSIVMRVLAAIVSVLQDILCVVFVCCPCVRHMSVSDILCSLSPIGRVIISR